MKSILKATILIVPILLTFITCNDNGVETQIEPGRRDYVWTEDTLKMGNEILTLTRIWANNPNDIWVLGFGSTSLVELWHYDGEQWNNENEPKPLNIIQPNSVFGFSNSDVWIGTAENEIWHYDGKSWSLYQSLSLEGFDRITIENIYGKSKNNIYAVGYAENYSTSDYIGIILHFNGTNWQFENIQNLKINLGFIYEQSKTGLMFILGTNFDNGLFLDKIFSFNGVELKEIASSYEGYGLGSAANEVFINSNQIVYKYSNNKLSLWKDFSNTNFLANIIGRNENDFINSSYDGIGHYNGINYETIYKTNLNINGYQVLEKNIFVITQEPLTRKSIIIHGWLK